MISCFFFFNDTATPEIYTLSLHDALPISMSSPWRSTAAAKIISHRNRKLAPTIQRIRHPYLSMGYFELGAVNLRGPDRHDLGAGGWAVGQHDAITVHTVYPDLLPHEGQRPGSRVSVRIARGVVDEGGVRHDPSLAVLTDRGRLESDSFRRFGVEYHALDVRSLDRLELGRLVMARRIVVIARACLAACRERYAGGDQHETRAGGTQLPTTPLIDA